MIVISTPADGAMKPARRPVFIRLTPIDLGTSSNIALPTEFTVSIGTQATAGLQAPGEPRSAEVAIFELRRLSGLTWDQLARLFEVSRRSVHFWASGKAMTAANEERLSRLVAAIRKVDRGSGLATRAALLTPTRAGEIPFNLLVAGQYDRVVDLVGAAAPRERRIARAALSADAQKARAPRRPGDLVSALQDNIHIERGRLISSKPIRKPRGK
jgi:hypothetical protein